MAAAAATKMPKHGVDTPYATPGVFGISGLHGFTVQGLRHSGAKMGRRTSARRLSPTSQGASSSSAKVSNTGVLTTRPRFGGVLSYTYIGTTKELFKSKFEPYSR